MYEWVKLGLKVPEVMLPGREVDLSSWSVLACDQYTADKSYWENVARDVGCQPSTLHQIIPEAYLEEEDVELRVHRAHKNMRDVLDAGTLQKWPVGAVIVERSWRDGQKRTGLLLAADLEAYDYMPGAKSLIRPSEGTIVERIPPRLALREAAPLEYPHILLLIDDPGCTAIEPLAEQDLFEPVYDFELGWNGGPLRGRHVPEAALTDVRAALSALYDESVRRYGNPFLMTTGDGNHSLATAKAHWEAVKRKVDPGEWADHPARYALVELVNIHNEGIAFEQIYRLLYHVPPGGAEKIQRLREKHAGSHALELACLQDALDEYMREEPVVRIDYIHGEEEARALARALPDSLLFAPDVIEKRSLFQTIAADGALPRKAFSMGEADQKRFYLEGRMIVRD